MTGIQNNLLLLFKRMVSFFEDNNLRYFAAYGSALGAVRHNGFIPWDDDIDIYMFREDYDRMLQIQSKLQDYRCGVVSLYDDGYYLPFAKIIDPDTTVWEMEKLPFLIGNFIDIFPLDRFDCTDEEMICIQKKSRAKFFDYQATVSSENLVDAFKYLVTRHKTSMIRALRQVWYHGTKREEKLGAFLEYSSNYKGGRGKKCVCVNMPAGLFFQTSWFEEIIDMPFEDTTIAVPYKYDEYLTRLYGDWRTPPPPDKQVAKHDDFKYYMNLKERLSIEEVSKRIKQGETLVL